MLAISPKLSVKACFWASKAWLGSSNRRYKNGKLGSSQETAKFEKLGFRDVHPWGHRSTLAAGVRMLFEVD
jgi:hypothetical protein